MSIVQIVEGPKCPGPKHPWPQMWQSSWQDSNASTTVT